MGRHRGRQLRAAAAIALIPVVLAMVAGAIIGQPVSEGARYALIIPLGLAMRIQTQPLGASPSPT